MDGGEAEALEAQRRLAAHFAQMLGEDEEELQDASDMKEVQAEAPKDPEVISEGDDGHSFKLFSGTVHLQRIRLLGLDETGSHTATTRPEHYYEWSPETEDLVRDQCRLASVTASEIISWAQHAVRLFTT